jgi:hypothetical protein
MAERDVNTDDELIADPNDDEVSGVGDDEFDDEEDDIDDEEDNTDDLNEGADEENA